MITCPTCGAQNDSGNRFCDQCGSPLDAASSTAPTVSVDTQQSTVATTTCPSCGATVLPGEAFCDSCGAPLPAATSATAPPVTSNDAPTILAASVADATPVGTPIAASDTNMITCPVCGHQNMAGDSFCDNCGADLRAPAPAASNDAPTALNPVVVPDPAEAASSPATTSTAEPVVTLPEEAILPGAPDATASQPTEEASAPTVAPVAAADNDAERQRLEEAIATQQKVVAQLEQTQAALGAATPDVIVQALQGARDALAQAESDLQALTPAVPAVDPAEVARLEEAIATQQKVVSQLEQTQAALGAATPAPILQALQDAQVALAQAQTDLQSLTGGSAATSAPVHAAAATEETAPVAGPSEATTPAPVADHTTVPNETQSVQPSAAPAPGPRLVMVEGNTEVTLPTDKAEIVIGREDPISQIFPEVDLTPFGGESGGVSRQHARLNHQNGQWTITDLNSTNYTRVDGTKIDPNTPVPLQDGARLQFGRVATVFHT